MGFEQSYARAGSSQCGRQPLKIFLVWKIFACRVVAMLTIVARPVGGAAIDGGRMVAARLDESQRKVPLRTDPRGRGRGYTVQLSQKPPPPSPRSQPPASPRSEAVIVTIRRVILQGTQQTPKRATLAAGIARLMPRRASIAAGRHECLLVPIPGPNCTTPRRNGGKGHCVKVG